MHAKWPFSCLLMAVSVTTFGQSPLPTEVELRAAYCIPVLQNDITNLRKVLANVDAMLGRIDEAPPEARQHLTETLQESKRDTPKQIEARESALNRLQLFILPRMQYLDASALLGAAARANADLQDSAAEVRRCTSECAANKDSSCIKTCMGSDLQARLNACRNPTWLPF
jgi:hypothetical protein